MTDARLISALRQLGDILSAPDVPAEVVALIPLLDEKCLHLFTTVIVQDKTVGATHGIPHLEPSGLLTELIAAGRARDWPKFASYAHVAFPGRVKLGKLIPPDTPKPSREMPS